MEEINDGYPLRWPLHWRRTPEDQKRHSPFRNTFGAACQNLLSEIRLLGGKNPVISSNLRLRTDGLPYSNQRDPEDNGIAVYFDLFDKQQCIPCDKWKSTLDNLIAITKTICALRGIERWGAKDMVEAAFRGFQALPAPDDALAMGQQYFEDCDTGYEVRVKYLNLVKELHPDNGGDNEEFVRMRQQMQEKIKEVERGKENGK